MVTELQKKLLVEYNEQKTYVLREYIGIEYYGGKRPIHIHKICEIENKDPKKNTIEVKWTPVAELNVNGLIKLSKLLDETILGFMKQDFEEVIDFNKIR